MPWVYFGKRPMICQLQGWPETATTQTGPLPGPRWPQPLPGSHDQPSPKGTTYLQWVFPSHPYLLPPSPPRDFCTSVHPHS